MFLCLINEESKNNNMLVYLMLVNSTIRLAFNEALEGKQAIDDTDEY